MRPTVRVPVARCRLVPSPAATSRGRARHARLGAAALLALLAACAPRAQKPAAETGAAEAQQTRATPPPDWNRPVEAISTLRADADHDFVPDRVGDEVLVGGRVTAGTGLVRADRTELYIQDGTGGLRLMLPPRSTPVLTGDSVQVHGIVSFRYGMAEMQSPNIRAVPTEARRITPVRLPDIPDAAGGSGPDIEGHEGELIEIAGYVIQSDSVATGRLFFLMAGTHAVQVFAYSMRAAPVRFDGIGVGDYVRVRGVAAQYDMAAPYNAGYVVYPLDSGDVRRVGISPRAMRMGATVIGSLLGVALLWAFLLRREVRKRTEALGVSEARYAHLFNAAADLVIVLDVPRSGAFTSANAAAQRAFNIDEWGRRPDGAQLLLADIADAPADAVQYLRAANQDGTATSVLDLRCADGRIVPYEIATRRLDTAEGTAHVAIARDVYDRRLYENGLVEAMETAQTARAAAEDARLAAEEADRLKGSIFTNLSHELRTPLTAIIGYADILCDEAPPDMVEFAETIRDGGQRLLRTLTDVLDLARLDSLGGDEAVATETFDAIATIRATVAEHAGSASAKGVALRFGSDTPAAEVTHVPDDVRRIISVLVGNAVKFTDTGEIRVSLYGAPEHIAVRVQDTGIGISEAFLGEIFEPFRQESDGHDRGYEGTGLGLTVARRLSERMGGQIRVWSRRGEGSLFEVVLPRRAPALAPPAERTGPVASASAL